MSTLIRIVRWTLFLPVGLLAGCAATALYAGVFGALFGGWLWSSCLVLAMAAFLQPLAGYRVGLAIAPGPGKAARYVMKAPYAVLGGSAALMLAKLLFGGDVSLGPGAEHLSGPAWWQTLAYTLGVAFGSNLVLGHTGPPDSSEQEAVAAISDAVRWDYPTPN